MNLKSNLIKIIISFIILGIIGWFISSWGIEFILNKLPSGINIVAFNPMEAFIVYLNFAVMFAFICLIPFGLYLGINYVRPALLKEEKKVLNLILLFGTLLFSFGMFMGLTAYMKFGLSWFSEFSNLMGYEIIWGLEKVINTLLSIAFFSGIVFEFPLILYFLTRYRIIDFKFNMLNRLIFIAILLIITGIITPDGSMVTQLFLTIPINLLTEGALYLGHKHKNKKEVSFKC